MDDLLVLRINRVEVNTLLAALTFWNSAYVLEGGSVGLPLDQFQALRGIANGGDDIHVGPYHISEADRIEMLIAMLRHVSGGWH